MCYVSQSFLLPKFFTKFSFFLIFPNYIYHYIIIIIIYSYIIIIIIISIFCILFHYIRFFLFFKDFFVPIFFATKVTGTNYPIECNRTCNGYQMNNKFDVH